MNYLFYETDPGVPPASLTDLSRAPHRSSTPPEWAWWEFAIDDVTRGEGDLMKSITDANDPDLMRFASVERGEAPDAVVAQHRTGGADGERPIFAYPDRAEYAGPAGGQDDPANWVRPTSAGGSRRSPRWHGEAVDHHPGMIT